MRAANGVCFHPRRCKGCWQVLLVFSWIWADASSLDPKLLECQIRKLSLRYAKEIQPFRSDFCVVRDALRLDELCPCDLLMDGETDDFQQDQYKACQGIKGETKDDLAGDEKIEATRLDEWWCPSNDDGSTSRCVYILSHPQQVSSGSASASHRTVTVSITEALGVARMIRQNNTRNQRDEPLYLVFRNGTHYIGETIELGPSDAGMILINYPGEEAWLSGGRPLSNRRNEPLKWHRYYSAKSSNSRRWGGVYTTSLLDAGLLGEDLPTLPSLFGTNYRWIRSRYPNANPETDQWGYRSPNKLKHSMPADSVQEWHKPPPGGPVPTFTFNPNLKNDSTMYNDYASGSGGVCSAVWGDGPSYWCSNASSGGWAEVDRECAMTGRLQLPVGLTFRNDTKTMRMPVFQPNAIVHAWHSQSWAMHMFVVTDTNQEERSVQFAPGGGRQGGRNWCRCDQCTYAGGWCGQHHEVNSTDDRLISGTWMVENVLDELDVPGEYYLDRTTMQLYVYPNSTDDLQDLRLAVLPQLIRIHNSSNIKISGLGFRDTSATYLDDWGVPSGGDWSLHRGGAVFIENSMRIDIESCTFRRLDGNAVFLSNWTRGIRIQNNLFEWLGENAVATWGWTNGFNATDEIYPMGTLINGNLMRELGIYQKQSSGVAHNKAALTVMVNNIMFNLPRAAINFNDNLGGGDIVDRNLIFNTCRESGDHGPINSWDRQPFLSSIGGSEPSFSKIRRVIKFNLIIANYGSSQGVDNDDGSSWYHLHHNVFYDADGFKMDYGGHDSIYERNLVIGFPHKTGCIGFGSFVPGHGHVVTNNYCIVPSVDSPIVQVSRCGSEANTVIQDNAYFGPSTNVTVLCGYGSDPIPFRDAQSNYGIEQGSTLSTLPTNEEVLSLANQTLYPERQSEFITAS